MPYIEEKVYHENGTVEVNIYYNLRQYCCSHMRGRNGAIYATSLFYCHFQG